MKIQLYTANSTPPPDPTEDGSIEVGVIINSEHHTGYYFENNWWVNFNDITVGHRQVDDDEIEYWYFLGVYEG